MFNIKEMILSAIIKKGILYEANKVDVNVDIPNGEQMIKINFKADNMKLKIEKSEEWERGLQGLFLFARKLHVLLWEKQKFKEWLICLIKK